MWWNSKNKKVKNQRLVVSARQCLAHHDVHQDVHHDVHINDDGDMDYVPVCLVTLGHSMCNCVL